MGTTLGARMPQYAPFRHVNEVKISRTWFSPPPTHVADMYHLYIRYFEDGDWQRYPLTHIPKNVQSAIEEGLVKALHLEILPLNGAASWALPGSPGYAVLGVELKDGTRVNSVPPALVKVFRRKLLESLYILFVGLALSKSPYPWFGGVFFGYGVYRFISALKLPRKPGWPPSSPR